MLISIEEARKLLKGPDTHTDAEMEQVIKTAEVFANFAFKHWMEERRKIYEEKTNNS